MPSPVWTEAKGLGAVCNPRVQVDPGSDFAILPPQTDTHGRVGSFSAVAPIAPLFTGTDKQA